MSVDRYKELFEILDKKNEGAFIPFLTVGDPSVEDSIALIKILIEGGADALELGIPFSDPIADGPVIQAASVRALEAGVTPTSCLLGIKEIRSQFPKIPIGLLIYANLVDANGMDNFYKQAADAGVDSVLVADVPLAEIAPFKASAAANGISTVLIVPPNSDEALVREVSSQSEGYTYVVARPGVTGAGDSLDLPASVIFDTLKETKPAPPVIGFGISKPDHVKQALAVGAKGAISGSAVVTIASEYGSHREKTKKALLQFVKEMKAATRR